MKSNASAYWLSIALIGCASAETTPPPAATPATEGNETAVVTVAATPPASTGMSPADTAKHYLECWGDLTDKKWDAFSTCYAENATSQWLDTGMPPVASRTDIIEKQVKPFVAAFPDYRGDVQLMLLSGHTGVSLAIARGTHEGTLLSPTGAIPATHKKIGMLVAHTIEFNDKGEGTNEMFVQDMGTMMAQLGLSPAPARPVLDANWPQQETVIASGSATEQANLAAGAKLAALFNAHDKAMLDLCADDVVDHNPSFPADLKGKAAMGGLMDGFWKGFTNLSGTVSSQWAAGDYVVTMFDFGGKNDGPVAQFGISTPTGKTFSVHVIEITKWKDGKVTDIWPMFNGAAVANQLGLIPPPSAAAPAAAPAKTKGKSKAKP